MYLEERHRCERDGEKSKLSPPTLFTTSFTRRRSSNLRLQIHLRHQFQQLNNTSTSTHKKSSIFTIEKFSNNLFEREAKSVDIQGSDRETKSGSEED